MRSFIQTATAAILVAFVLLAACSSNDKQSRNITTADNANVADASATPQTPGDGVQRITTVELRAMMDRNEAVVIDVRGEDSYNAGHIKGALLMSTDKLLTRLNELPRDKMIVAYCS